MSIRPIDHNVMIPKTQEVANIKQVENLKNRNIVESGFIQQEKLIKNNSKKVLNTEKSIYNKVRDEDRPRDQRDSDRKKRNKDGKLLVEEEIDDPNVGHNIDIRI